MKDIKKPCREVELTGAPLTAVLLHGLALDTEDPALGVLLAARDELGLLATLAEVAHPGVDFDLATLVPVLERVARSLDVVHELILRARKEGAPGELLEQ